MYPAGFSNYKIIMFHKTIASMLDNPKGIQFE